MYLKSLKVLVVLLLTVLGTKAQRSNIVIGPELSLPTGNATNQSPIGFGGYLKGEVAISQKFSLTGTAGIATFLGKKFLNSRAETLTHLPLKVGVKYYNDKDFYFEGQTGISKQINSDAKPAFAGSLGAGSFIKNRRNNNQLDIGLRYEGWRGSKYIMKGSTAVGSTTTTFGFFSLRAGYAFNL
ncbi:MAG: hypothetical protein EOO07_12895 [Chitinophagaceae bacterium]|nr:MAG: hypothetical protein EOO07_12895 [Chitinophagaceae bacterium]